jgi:hypothetical protein
MELLDQTEESDAWIAAALAVTLSNGKRDVPEKEHDAPVTNANKWRRRKLDPN